MQRIRDYLRLTKPGVLAGNVISSVGGFMLAAAGQIDWGLFFAMLTGMTLVIAAACVVNNYLDRDIDAVMERTKSRPSVASSIPGWHMVLFGSGLVIAGTIVLALWTNWLTVGIGLAGFVVYVWLYGEWSKRKSIHGTAVGAVSGALPIAGGYAAVSGRIDLGLVLVFLIMFFWQFPAFYSIAIYLRDQYAKAKVPVMSVVKGVQSTTLQIAIYSVLFMLSVLSLTLLGYAGGLFALVMVSVSLCWVTLALVGLKAADPEAWARQMFKFGLLMLMLLTFMLSVDFILP